ncbi:putative transcription factor C2H2 family [Helianthus debilis subsp. tardiflorus]
MSTTTMSTTTMSTTTTTIFPDEFKCPVSLEIMSDPVILSSGHTFDRFSIQRWLDAGHRTCPVTKLPLSSNPSLIPNHALRSLISNYTSSDFPKSLQTHQDSETVILNLTSKKSSPEVKLVSIEQLCVVSKRDFELHKNGVWIRVCL